MAVPSDPLRRARRIAAPVATATAVSRRPWPFRLAAAARVRIIRALGGNRPLDDTTLIARIGSSGDKAAMKLLYERHHEPLYRFLNARLRDPFEASDVMQEAFLEVWRAAPRFEGRSSVRTWLFGIARNKAVDRMRRGSRVVLSEPDDTLPDDSPDPEAVAVAASDAARLRGCIGKLSDSHRSAIQLAYFQDLPYAEIAEIEGVPVGTVKTRILHAKRLLMHCLTRPGR